MAPNSLETYSPRVIRKPSCILTDKLEVFVCSRHCAPSSLSINGTKSVTLGLPTNKNQILSCRISLVTPMSKISRYRKFHSRGVSFMSVVCLIRMESKKAFKNKDSKY